MAEPGFVPLLVRFATLAVQALSEAREEIDSLNVYPVPDGDTGTNLLLTFESGSQALRDLVSDSGGPEVAGPEAASAAYARGLLLGARGNSGVIMSELAGAMLSHLARADQAGHDRDVVCVLAEAMTLATEAGYAAVGRPVEGTMLSVARAASDQARRTAGQPATRVSRVLETAAEAAREALARTPEQLEVLRRAGVVDAGGLGLCLVLEAATAACTGRRQLPSTDRLPRRQPRPPGPPVSHDAGQDEVEGPGSPAYEVMYLLDAGEEVIPRLRETLQALGDSLVVVGGHGLWNVHVHVDDVGAAVEAGIAAGRPHRVRITHLADHVAAGARAPRRAGHSGRGVVVVSSGPGLTEVFGQAGAAVVEASVSSRPSTGELLEAIRATGAAEAIVVTNDRDVVPAAEAAARLAESDHGVRVAVVPTAAQVQGLAAVAVHDPDRPFEHDLVEMTAAARHARTGAVTIAARRAITTAGECQPGDVLGAVEGDFVVVGEDQFTVAVEVIERLLGGGGELVTVVAGEGGGELARRCAAHLAHSHPGVDVAVHDGGQQRYPVLFGVE